MRTTSIVFVILTVCLRAVQPTPASFTTAHVPHDEAGHFAFPSGESESYFTDALFALKIDSVYADGIALTASPHESTLRWHIGAKIFRPLLPTKMIYRLHCRQFVSVVSRDKSGALNLVSFDIPIDAKKLEVGYRVRYPNGKISPEMTLTSLSSYDFKEVDDKTALNQPTQRNAGSRLSSDDSSASETPSSHGPRG